MENSTTATIVDLSSNASRQQLIQRLGCFIPPYCFRRALHVLHERLAQEPDSKEETNDNYKCQSR